jgi:hypothetical protein
MKFERKSVTPVPDPEGITAGRQNSCVVRTEAHSTNISAVPWLVQPADSSWFCILLVSINRERLKSVVGEQSNNLFTGKHKFRK